MSDELPPGLRAAVESLLELGWTVLPPPEDAIPYAAAGQTWVSPRARVQPRTVTLIGPSRGWRDDDCVHFTVPHKRGEGALSTGVLKAETFRAWARKTGARPLEAALG